MLFGRFGGGLTKTREGLIVMFFVGFNRHL